MAAKRRKIEELDGAQNMSAFALTRQLLAKDTPASVRDPVTSRDPSTPDLPEPEPALKSKRRHKTTKKVPRVGGGQAVDEPEAIQTARDSPLEDIAVADAINLILVQNEPSSLAAKVVQFSTFRPSKHNFRKLAGGIVELKLDESERFLVLGSFGIRVTTGELTISGAILRPSGRITWSYAPHCHAIPVLRSSERTVVELHANPKAASLRNLENLSPLFRKLWNEPVVDKSKQNEGSQETFQIIYTSDDAPSRAVIQDLVSPPAWNKKLAELVERNQARAFVVLLCGPKSSGKSTFGRILGNRLITENQGGSRSRSSRGIAILDLDPGQPEYSPAGTMSLVHVKQPNLGPSFTHPLLDEAAGSVIRCHAMASVSPASDPELYLECALDLYSQYQSVLRGCPLIINTPGWVLGTGLDLLTELINKIRPTEVVYMSEDGPGETVESLQSACKGVFSTLPSQQSKYSSRTAAHFRAMQTMSYFHTTQSNQGFAWDATALSALPPLQVKYAGHDRGILGIFSYEYQPPADLIAETINGGVLCAVEIEDLKAFRGMMGGKADFAEGTGGTMDVDDDNDNPMALRSVEALESIVSEAPEGFFFIRNPDSQTLDPHYSHALGLVLIRGIDVKNSTLQILTPITMEQIRESKRAGRYIVLVHGKFDPPSWAYTEDLYSRSLDSVPEEDGRDGVEVIGEDSDSDDSEAGPDNLETAGDVSETPWVEVLRGNEKRPVGSRVWRVRRDLGKGAE